MKQFKIVTAFLLLLSSMAHSQTIHKDPSLGFRITLPKEWIQMPANPESPWLLKQFYCDKSYPYDSRTQTGAHRTLRDHPRLILLCFPIKENSFFKQAPVDYEASLKRRLDKDRWSLRTKKSSDRISSFDVTAYETIAHSADASRERAFMAMEYPLSKFKVVLEFETAPEVAKKIKNDFRKIFKSFVEAEVKTEKNFPQLLDDSVLCKAGLEEANKTLVSNECDIYKAFLAALPSSWKTDKSKEMLIAYNGGEKVVKQVANHVPAMFDWMENRFGLLKEEGVVRKPVVLIFKEYQERTAFNYRRYGRNALLFTVQAPGRPDRWNLESLSNDCVRLWFIDKDYDLYLALPVWLRNGLFRIFNQAFFKGRALVFKGYSKKTEHPFKQLRKRIKEKTVREPYDIVRLTKEDFIDERELSYDATGLIRLFLTNKKYKGVLLLYLEELLTAINTHQEEINAEVLAHPEYVQDPYGARAEVWDSHRERVNLIAIKKVFDAWSAKEWKAVKKAFLAQF